MRFIKVLTRRLSTGIWPGCGAEPLLLNNYHRVVEVGRDTQAYNNYSLVGVGMRKLQEYQSLTDP